MQKKISFNALQSILRVFNLFKRLNLLSDLDYIVQWEQRPQMVLVAGNVEYENPEDVYGCSLTFWDENGKLVYKVKFKVDK